MTEKTAVTSSARIVQAKKKAPLGLEIPAVMPDDPFMWRMGTADARSDRRRTMTYPNRPSTSTSIAYSQTTRKTTTVRFESPPGEIL